MPLSYAVIDANEKTNHEYAIHETSSVISFWLLWELEQADCQIVDDVTAADVVLVAYAGGINWRRSVSRTLNKLGIEPDANKRERPYLIAGGPVDVAPFTALSIANGLAIGEAYAFVRSLFDCQTLDDVRQFITDYPHALERSQVVSLAHDQERPYLLAAPPSVPLASPDAWVDWEGQPLVRGNDKVVRVIASKGCHLKCKFCATTYRQTYRPNPNQHLLAAKLDRLSEAGERVQMVTNDVGVLDALHLIKPTTDLDSQSLTIKSVRDKNNLQALVRSGMKIARFGVEGITPRIRQAFGKPIDDDELINIVASIHHHKRNSHLFYIVGAPYETVEDWAAHETFMRRLLGYVQWGLIRFKYTAFTPYPPTPLARFLPSRQYYDNMQHFRDRYLHNFVNRHAIFVWGAKPENSLRDVADGFAISLKYLKGLQHDTETIDLFPTLDDWLRAPWEIIEWPLSAKRRYILGGSYQKWMGHG